MYNSYPNFYTNQNNLEKINYQISELERLKQQIQQPAPITQNFQLAPTSTIRYVKSIEDVQKTNVIGDTPFFSQDMAVLWVKNGSGEVKTYELKEIVNKDEKDLKIDFLMAQIEELKKGMIVDAKSNDADANESVESKKPSNGSNGRTSKTKSE